MAFPTLVNSQTTDSVTQANVQMLGSSPAMAMGSLYVATSQALANAAQNATAAQANTNQLAQAATKQGVSLIYSIKPPKGL